LQSNTHAPPTQDAVPFEPVGHGVQRVPQVAASLSGTHAPPHT
jgi:hypothetical protein